MLFLISSFPHFLISSSSCFSSFRYFLIIVLSSFPYFLISVPIPNFLISSSSCFFPFSYSLSIVLFLIFLFPHHCALPQFLISTSSCFSSFPYFLTNVLFPPHHGINSSLSYSFFAEFIHSSPYSFPVFFQISVEKAKFALIIHGV